MISKVLAIHNIKSIIKFLLVISLFLIPTLIIINNIHPLSQITSAQNIKANNTDLTIPEIYQKTLKSVVWIKVYSPLLGQLGGGSGFIYDSSGHIITNNHVVTAGQLSIGNVNLEVTFYDGSVYPAKVIGSDPLTDIAVVQVDTSVPSDKIIPLSLGNSSELKTGEDTVVIGNPFGLKGTITNGIISSLGRTEPTTSLGLQFDIPDIIQTNAAINPGNSGGPMLNMRGEVTGIAVSTLVNSTGIGFVIPSSTINKVVPSLISNGSFRHPWLGIEGEDMTSAIANIMKLQEAKGVLVTSVIEGSSAAKAGIRGGNQAIDIPTEGRSVLMGGDVILKINNQDIQNFDDILVYIQRHTAVGDNVTLNILRNGQNLDVPVVLGAAPNG
jgi:S1-C subfamily serine protease